MLVEAGIGGAVSGMKADVDSTHRGSCRWAYKPKIDK